MTDEQLKQIEKEKQKLEEMRKLKEKKKETPIEPYE